MASLINKSACEALQKAIITALAPITTDTGIKVYDHIPGEQVTYPFVVVRDMSEQEWSTKTTKGHNITVVVENYIQEHSSLKTKSLNSLIITTLDTAFPYNYRGINNYDMTFHTLTGNAISEINEGVYQGTLNFNFYLFELPTSEVTNEANE